MGTDNSGARQGQVTYVGETGATLYDRQNGHQHNPDPWLRKDITLHPLALRSYSQWLAWAVEKYLYLRMKDAGYKMTNNPQVLKPAEINRCYTYLMRVAAEVVQQDGLWEKIQQVAPPPGGAP